MVLERRLDPTSREFLAGVFESIPGLGQKGEMVDPNTFPGRRARIRFTGLKQGQAGFTQAHEYRIPIPFIPVDPLHAQDFCIPLARSRGIGTDQGQVIDPLQVHRSNQNWSVFNITRVQASIGAIPAASSTCWNSGFSVPGLKMTRLGFRPRT